MKKRGFWQMVVASLVLVSMLGQGTWVLAGTTGGVSGTIVETGTNTPVADAKVSAVSPSQSISGTSDATGHFQFLNLAPDTYTLSVEKQGYEPSTYTGLNIFADQTQTLTISTQRSLRQIGAVTARAASELVRPGISTDIYTVSASQATKAAGLGGGGSQNSSYSAVASVPGLVLLQGQAGWNQAVYIRGAAADTTGYEYDGVPVNRSFDNYAAHTASSLGQQQLQVYTGGGPASVSAAGVSGFINDVIKSGTYPGFFNVDGGEGAPQFYHKLGVEFGGASPDRNFSYYVGLSGYNQSFRYGDQFNGSGQLPLTQAQLAVPGSGALDGFAGFLANTWTGAATIGACGPNGQVPAATAAAPHSPVDFFANAGCFIPYDGLLTNELSDITDRENVVNLHFGIPHKNGLKDDIQFLGSASALRSAFYSSPNDIGPGIGTFTLANTGAPYDPNPADAGFNVPHYVDAYVYNLPFGTPVAGKTSQIFFQPSSPQNRAFDAPLDPNQRDLFNNDTGIFKLQYTHNFSSRAYARAFAYTFFSDWTQAGFVDSFQQAAGGNIGTSVVAQNYDLITHTAGLNFTLADQISDQHLLNFSADLTRANVTRFNNNGFLAGASPTNLVSKDASGQYHCYDGRASDGAAEFTELPCTSTHTRILANAGPQTPGFAYPVPTAGSPAALANAQWVTTWNGESDGTFNNVGPRFQSYSLTDHFKPGDKFTFDFGARLNVYGYNLGDTATPANDYYTQQVQKYVCYDPLTDVFNGTPLSPTTPPPPAPVFTNGPCAAQSVGGVMHQFVHPDGTVQNGVQSTLFTDVSPAVYTITDVSPRFSVSFAANPDTVIRASVGRYTQPPISASVQYNRAGGTAATKLLAPSFIPIGFFSPFHPIQEQSAINSDLSLEQHLRGTDVSFKLTPYYRTTANWSQDQLIGQNFVTHLPTGTGRDYGLEFQITKGDFNRNGFSGQLSYTYTNSKVQYHKVQGIANSQIDNINDSIKDYNTLTKAGGGSPCYTNAGNGTPDPACGPTSILNPYYNNPLQSTLDPSGWYDPTSTSSYTTAGVDDIGLDNQYTYPHSIVGILNYRHEKFSITPSLQFQSGSSYGSPLDVIGVDPRICTANSTATPATASLPAYPGIPTALSPLQPDYLSCFGAGLNGYFFVPNPETGKFATIGQYTQPSLMTLNVQMSYAVSKGVTANLLLSNLYHTCFGGSQASWTSAYPPGQEICGYVNNGFYPGAGFYNGSSPNDTVANGVAVLPALSHPFSPSLFPLSGAGPLPFNAYFSLDIKL